ncbi:MAG: hypothetical protein J7L99_06205 [Planctomycetes bacterium]|nr:hypothetical protein [Planctomycetota bacterium]
MSIYPLVWNWAYHFLGAVALLMNKLRYAVRGYRRSRDFSPSQFERCVDYDFQVVENWLGYVEDYLHRRVELSGKVIVELGAGQDLGTGLILLAKGAERYYAVDAHDLLIRSNQPFYDALFERLSQHGIPAETLDELSKEIKLSLAGQGRRIVYCCIENFDLSVLSGIKADFVFSQAAFEHFDDVAKTICQLDNIVRPGAVFLAVVDLQTHTRFLREHDPLNIYRYSDSFYRLCKYTSQPNRLRPADYCKILAENGWQDVQVIPLQLAKANYLDRVRPYLNNRFRNDKSQMEYLTVAICATKGNMHQL